MRKGPHQSTHVTSHAKRDENRVMRIPIFSLCLVAFTTGCGPHPERQNMGQVTIDDTLATRRHSDGTLDCALACT